ncbi:hypothetical protein [Thermodesulfitimonas autotrophica]|uniref:hypothetical protein n=1 Tax=Thermodesulfitimonas autotrophica TaxID=1894989 RepID=UPI002FE1E4AE
MPKRSTWTWDQAPAVLYAERNVARDVKLSRCPDQAVQKCGQPLHTGEIKDALRWQWPGDADDRVFLVPADLLEIVKPSLPLSRDLIIVVGHLFRIQHYPENRMIETSFRQLTELLALEWAGGKTVEALDNALTLARWLTIKNYPVIRKLYPNGQVKELSHDTVGFIDRVSRIVIRNGKEIPANKQPLEIYLSETYALAIKKLPAAPIPITALEVAHKAPRRIRTPIKNLALYLASRVPLQQVILSKEKLADILGYTNLRNDKFLPAAERVLKALHPVMVNDFTLTKEKTEIVLAGKYQEIKNS